MTGRLALPGQNLICCIYLKIQPKTIQNRAFSENSYFLRFIAVNKILTMKRQLTRQSLLVRQCLMSNRHPYRGFYEKLKMVIFGHNGQFGGHILITNCPKPNFFNTEFPLRILIKTKINSRLIGNIKNNFFTRL